MDIFSKHATDIDKADLVQITLIPKDNTNPLDQILWSGIKLDYQLVWYQSTSILILRLQISLLWFYSGIALICFWR